MNPEGSLKSPLFYGNFLWVIACHYFSKALSKQQASKHYFFTLNYNPKNVNGQLTFVCCENSKMRFLWHRDNRKMDPISRSRCAYFEPCIESKFYVHCCFPSSGKSNWFFWWFYKDLTRNFKNSFAFGECFFAQKGQKEFV